MKDADEVRGMIQEVGSRGKVLYIEISAVQRLVLFNRKSRDVLQMTTDDDRVLRAGEGANRRDMWAGWQ